MVEKRSATIIVALLLALGLGARGAGPFQQVGADGLVIMEAEDFDANISQGGHDFVLVTDPPGFSGKGAMRSLPDSGDIPILNEISVSRCDDLEVLGQ